MVYEIDGVRFGTLEEFFNEVSVVVIPGSGVFRAQAAFRSESTRLSHSPTWFQLANVWLAASWRKPARLCDS
jgi:hypothetical protein